jgi:hypothetical protein
MHIDDWSPEFLSKFSADEYYGNLVKAKVWSAMVYLQSHVGLCYWPTDSGLMHGAFRGRGDAVKRLVDKCRAGGMSVTGYYSLIFNTWAEILHPEWRIIKDGGKSWYEEGSRYGLCCPNNPEYRAFALAQIKEISEYFTLDGMFYDMTYWEHVCRCPACKKRWADEVGGEMPAEDWGDASWKLFVQKRQLWLAEFARLITDKTREDMPGVTVQHNCSAMVSMGWVSGQTERISDLCDFTGGDLYGDLYSHIFVCKYYMGLTNNPPFEYQTCRVNNRLYQHTVTKTEEMLTQEVLLTAAYHGASMLIDAIDPDGSMDGRVYEKIGRVFASQSVYEPYMGRGEYLADVGVVFDAEAKHGDESRGYGNQSCSVRAAKTLAECRVACGVAAGKLEGYKAVVAPDMGMMSAEAVKNLTDYVKNGGKLYFSGLGNAEIFREFFGAEYLGVTEETVTYAAPAREYEGLFGEFNQKYPVHSYYRQPLFEKASGAEVLAHIALPYTVPGGKIYAPGGHKFASIHSDPPGKLTGYPSVMMKGYGKGAILWSGIPVENEERVNYKRIFTAFLGLLLPESERVLKTDAPKFIDVPIFKDGGGFLFSCVDLSEADGLREHSFTVDIRCAEKPSSVKRISDGRPMAFEYAGGRVKIRIEDFKLFEMYSVCE